MKSLADFSMFKPIAALKRYVLIISVALVASGLSACSSDDEEPMRTLTDIEGVWTPGEDLYMNFRTDNIVENLTIEYQDGQSIGRWSDDEVYFYEPGYNLVIYLTADHHAEVYEVVELTDNRLTWCWVYSVESTNVDSVSQIIGEIINKAQEGFHLDPELYEYFNRISEDNFLEILEGLDIIYYPWDEEY